MDRTWTYRNIHLIISLLVIRTSEISSKEYYCTKAGTWEEAMTSCTRSSGVPLSYRDVYNSTEFTLKYNRTVWTADYIYLEYVTDIAQGKGTEWYECGYLTFDVWWEGRTYMYHYEPRSGTQYGPCTASKQYACESPTKRWVSGEPLTWADAFSECSSYTSYTSYALWDGSYFTLNKKVENLELWVRRLRRFTQGTVNGAIITIGNNIIKTCGTSVEEVKRNNNDNCDEYLESVCVFDDTVTDTDTFTRTCFEDQTTEVSVNVTRWPLVGSTIFTTADAYDNKTSTEHKGQAGDSTVTVVATFIASLTVCCILIGIGLFCYRKQRRRKVNENNTTLRYANENLSTTTTDRNSPDTNDSVNDRANAVDIADENYEAYDAPSGLNSMDDVYITTEQHGEYGNVYSACRKETRSEKNNNAAASPIEESEYDSTRNIKEYDQSSNIYNTLGFHGAESVYDSGHYNKDKGLQVDSSTYSSCSIQDNTYNTAAGLNCSRQNHGHGLLSSHDNVYSISTIDTNQHDKTYGNIGKIHQTADRSSIYDTAYHNGT